MVTKRIAVIILFMALFSLQSYCQRYSQKFYCSEVVCKDTCLLKTLEKLTKESSLISHDLHVLRIKKSNFPESYLIFIDHYVSDDLSKYKYYTDIAGLRYHLIDDPISLDLFTLTGKASYVNIRERIPYGGGVLCQWIYYEPDSYIKILVNGRYGE